MFGSLVLLCIYRQSVRYRRIKLITAWHCERIVLVGVNENEEPLFGDGLVEIVELVHTEENVSVKARFEQ